MNMRLLLLTGVAVILGGVVLLDPFGADPAGSDAAPETRPGATANTATRSAPDPAAPVEAAGPFLPGFERYRVIEQRPLFAADRRPPRQDRPVTREPEPRAEPQPSRPPDFLITGVVAGPEGRGAALIQYRGESQRLQVGDRIEGWTLEAVEAGAVIVSRDDESWRLPVGPREDP